MKIIKLFESFDKSEYYKPLEKGEYGRWVGGFTSDKHPLWNFNKNDIKEFVSYFIDWDIYIKPSQLPKKDKYELFILSKGTSLKWLCPDPHERKKIMNMKGILSHRKIEDFQISDILITGPRLKGYQIHDYEDEYFTCMINDKWGNTEECYECDQIEGLIQLLKDLKIIT